MMSQGSMSWIVAATAATALAGCTFGDEKPQQAQAVIGPWYDQNCVPAECMYQCCQGWAYDPDPHLRGGNVPGAACEKVRQRNAAYSDYVNLMLDLQNLCPDDFKYWESGYCYVVNPSDAIEGFRPDGQIIYSKLSFLVCPPQGQDMAFPMEDVELIPEN